MRKRREQDAHLHDRSRSGGFARKSSQRPLKTTILIVTDGGTESNYLDGLRKDDAVRRSFALSVKNGHGRSPSQLVDMALAHIDKSGKGGKGYDHTYCIMDVEGHASLGRRESLAKASKEAMRKHIDLCLSNPSFEVWFLSHFERSGGSYGNSDAVIAQLNRYWQSRFATDYEKNDSAIYRRLRDNTRTAIENARWVREVHHKENTDTADCNSSTDVYKLVSRLLESG